MKLLRVNNIPKLESSWNVKLYEKAKFYMPWHIHDLFELTCITQGQGTRVVGDKVESFFEGDLLLIGPNLPHVWRSDTIKRRAVKARSITVHFSRDFPMPCFFDLPEMQAVKALLDASRGGVELRGELRNLCESKMRRLLQIDPAHQVILILKILADIAISNEIRHVAGKGYTAPSKTEASRWQRISEFVFDNFQCPITNQELAEVAEMHPASLARYFKSSVGMSPTQYVNQVRIGQACRLLGDADRSILDICFDCGFQNLSHFNRCFKSITKMTPTQYRKKVLAVA